MGDDFTAASPSRHRPHAGPREHARTRTGGVAMRLALKFTIVFLLTLAILVPLAMIRGTISERQQYRQQAVDELSAILRTYIR